MQVARRGGRGEGGTKANNLAHSYSSTGEGAKVCMCVQGVGRGGPEGAGGIFITELPRGGGGGGGKGQGALLSHKHM